MSLPYGQGHKFLPLFFFNVKRETVFPLVLVCYFWWVGGRGFMALSPEKEKGWEEPPSCPHAAAPLCPSGHSHQRQGERAGKSSFWWAPANGNANWLTGDWVWSLLSVCHHFLRISSTQSITPRQLHASGALEQEGGFCVHAWGERLWVEGRSPGKRGHLGSMRGKAHSCSSHKGGGRQQPHR